MKAGVGGHEPETNELFVVCLSLILDGGEVRVDLSAWTSRTVNIVNGNI